jgi:flotillin
VQEARVQQVERMLEADVVAPANAEMARQRARAQAHAATILEEGKATVSVLNAMIHTWKQGGDAARDIFLMQKLQTMMDALVGTIADIKVNRITVLPSNDGSTAKKAVTLVEELKAGTGIDIPQIVDRMTSSSTDG